MFSSPGLLLLGCQPPARRAMNLGGCSYNQDRPGLCVAKWGEAGLNKAPCMVSSSVMDIMKWGGN